MQRLRGRKAAPTRRAQQQVAITVGQVSIRAQQLLHWHQADAGAGGGLIGDLIRFANIDDGVAGSLRLGK